MKTNPFLWTIFFAILTGCASQEVKIKEDHYSGVYVAETVYETGTQWDTLEVRKVRTGNPDPFLIIYNASFVKKLANGQMDQPKMIHDTFTGVFNTYYKVLMVNGRPMHIDTIYKTAMFGGIPYKKIQP